MQVRETRLESHDGARDSRARKVSPGASSLTRVLRKKPIGLFHATKVDFSRKWALAADEPGYRSTEKYRATKDSLQFRNVLRKGRRDLGAARHNHPLRRPLPVTEPRFPPRDRPRRLTAPFVTDEPVVRPPRKVSRLRENRHGCRRKRLHSGMGPFQPPGPAPRGFLRARRGAAARRSR